MLKRIHFKPHTVQYGGVQVPIVFAPKGFAEEIELQIELGGQPYLTAVDAVEANELRSLAA